MDLSILQTLQKKRVPRVPRVPLNEKPITTASCENEQRDTIENSNVSHMSRIVSRPDSTGNGTQNGTYGTQSEIGLCPKCVPSKDSTHQSLTANGTHGTYGTRKKTEVCAGPTTATSRPVRFRLRNGHGGTLLTPDTLAEAVADLRERYGDRLAFVWDAGGQLVDLDNGGDA